jgi:hypothetical protein
MRRSTPFQPSPLPSRPSPLCTACGPPGCHVERRDSTSFARFCPIPVGAEQVVPRAWTLLEDPAADLPIPLRQPLADACLEIRDCETRIGAVNKQLKALAAEIPIAQRLQSIPCVGLITATALVGFVVERPKLGPSAARVRAVSDMPPTEGVKAPPPRGVLASTPPWSALHGSASPPGLRQTGPRSPRQRRMKTADSGQDPSLHELHAPTRSRLGTSPWG